MLASLLYARIRFVRALLLLAVGLSSLADPAPASAAFSESALQNLLAGYASHSALAGATTACVVVDLADNHVLFSLRADQPLVPASQMKLLVSATALELLGADFFFSTTVWAQGPPDSRGRLPGNLYLYGWADPVAGAGIYPLLARQIRDKGVNSIGGDLVGTAPVLLEEKDAGLQGARRLAEALGRLGAGLAGRAREGFCPSAPVLLACHTTVSLADYLRNMNKESRNEEANRLLRCLMACFDDPAAGDPGFVLRYWTQRGLTTSGMRIVDGSGYSRFNRLSAGLLCGVLQRLAWSGANYRALSASLPVAGRDGTLASRMRGTPAEGCVRAKTGTLPQVSGLSGYVEHGKKPRLAFSLLMNGFSCSVSTVRRIQDQMAIGMARYVKENSE